MYITTRAVPGDVCDIHGSSEEPHDVWKGRKLLCVGGVYLGEEGPAPQCVCVRVCVCGVMCCLSVSLVPETYAEEGKTGGGRQSPI